MKKYLILLLIITATLKADELYLGEKPDNYLVGKIKGSKVLGTYKNPGESQNHYLRPDVIENFKEMINDYNQYRAGQKKAPAIQARSAFRSYFDQKSIWDGKYQGKRKMTGYKASLTPTQKVHLILKYSSAPGTSRHHWGTDIDINSFDNEYFEKGGKGELLYKWLQKNAKNYGFCQPYNRREDRNDKGYYQENWHWSFAPISQRLVREWKKNYDVKKKSILGTIEGIDSITEDMPITYVTSVNSY
ncbi:MAG: M15 family metallopeptidase, partial [Leptospiraceae bacterium]|nr:M15 family metallopeptidase [Leptospiraceae bacterium]